MFGRRRRLIHAIEQEASHKAGVMGLAAFQRLRTIAECELDETDSRNLAVIKRSISDTTAMVIVDAAGADLWSYDKKGQRFLLQGVPLFTWDSFADSLELVVAMIGVDLSKRYRKELTGNELEEIAKRVGEGLVWMLREHIRNVTPQEPTG